MTQYLRNPMPIAVLAALLVGLAFNAHSYGAAEEDQLVVTVGTTPYSHRQLFGIDVKELRARFDKDVRGYTDQALLAHLETGGYFQRHPEIKVKPATRAALEGAVFDSAYQAMLDFACRRLVLAHVADEVLRRHRAKAADYFDLNALNAALGKQLGLLDFLYDHKDEPASKNDALYTEADEKFGVAASKEGWGRMRDLLRARPDWMRWSSVALRQSQSVDQYALRALMAHYLFQESCAEGGVYYERAKTLVQLDNSEVYRIRISGYEGNPQLLQEYLSTVIDKDGDMAFQGVRGLQNWFAKAGMAARVDIDRTLGSMLAPVAGNQAPAVGAMTRTGPTAFEVLGWARKQDRAGTTDDQKKALAIFWRNRAYRMAIEDFLPEVKSAIGAWQPSVESLAAAVSVDGRALIMPEVKVGQLLRRPYSAKPFEEFEHHRAALQEFALRAALAAQKNDGKAVGAIRSDLANASHDAQTLAVRAAYDALAERLGKEFSGMAPINEALAPR